MVETMKQRYLLLPKSIDVVQEFEELSENERKYVFMLSDEEDKDSGIKHNMAHDPITTRHVCHQ